MIEFSISRVYVSEDNFCEFTKRKKEKKVGWESKMDFDLGHKEKDFNSSTEGRRDSISLGAEGRKGRE